MRDTTRKHAPAFGWAPQMVPYALAGVLSLAAGVVAWKTDQGERDARNHAERAEVYSQLDSLRLRLERSLTVPMVRTRGMAAQIIAHDGITPTEFYKVSEVLTRGYPAIRNIGVSHGTILDLIYPLAGNESALGVDYRTVDSQWPMVRHAIETHLPVVEGPVPLIQGGTGLIVRDPVYLVDATGNETRLFGLVSIVLNIPRVYAEAGLDRDDLPIKVAIRGQDGLGEKGRMILGDSSLFSDQPVELEVSFPYGGWRLAATPRKGWASARTAVPASTLQCGGLALLVVIIGFGTAHYVVDRRRLLHHIAGSEQRLRHVIGIASDGVHILDEEGNLVMCSQSFLRMLGYTDTEAGTLNVVDWDSAMPRDELCQRIQNYIKTPAVFETRHRRRDGTMLEVEINCSSLEQDGRFYLYASSRDITARKEAERTLRAAQRQLKALADRLGLATHISKIGVFEWDLASGRLISDDRISEIYGVTPDRAILTHDLWRERWHPDDRVRVENEIRAALTDGKPFEIEFRIQTTSGEVRHVQGAAVVERAEDGPPLRMIVVNWDITAIRRNEQALGERERLLKMITDAIPGPVGYWTSEWRCVFANPAYFPWFGKRPDEMIGIHVRDFLGEDLYRMNQDVLHGVMTGKRQVFERSLRRPDGSFYHGLFQYLPNVVDHHVMGFMTVVTDVTELKQAELEAARTRDEIEDLYENAPCGYHSLDQDGLIIRINQTELRWLGYEVADLVGKMKASDLMTPASREKFRNIFAEFKINGILRDLELDFLRKDGSILHGLVSATAIFDDGGQFIRSRSTVTDNGPRKQAEAALVESEVRFRGAFETAAHGMALVSTGGQFIKVNRALCTMLGYGETELLATDFQTVTHPDDLAADLCHWHDLLEGRIDSYQMEERYFHKNGDIIWIVLSVSLVRTVDGAPVHFVSHIQDITASKTALEQVARLATIVESSNDAIISEDLSGVITSWNRGAETLFGYTAAEAVGQPITMLLPPDRITEEWELLAVIIGGTAVAQHESRRVTKAGRLVDVAVTLSPIRNPQGKIIAASKIVRDINLRKQAEVALIDAKKLAEAADRAKSEFLANMSHEIRTPMNVILGLSHLICHTELTAEQRDYTNKISTAGRLLLGILNDILDFSKIEANRLDLDHRNFRLVSVFDDLAMMMSMAEGNQNLALTITVSPEIPRWVKGDPSRLHQILVNLVGNAVKFTISGSVAVRAELVERRPDAVVVRFSVRDTGIGMTREQLDRLFQPFSQADATTTRSFGGTGLGLAISKRLVTLMNGRIGVESTPGEGSAFWFIVPFGAGEADAEEEALDIPNDLSVLIAEDDPTARESLSALIRGLGWRDQIVASGQDAIAQVRDAERVALPYDVVLIDGQMPGLDGLATCRRLREESLSDPAPMVIMVMGFNRDDVQRSVDAVHVDAILVKPITGSMLYNTVAAFRAHGRGGTRSMVTGAGPIGTPRLAGIRILVVEDNAINQEVVRKILQNQGASVDVVDDGRQAVDWVHRRRGEIDLVLMDVQMPIMDGFEASTRIRVDLQERDLPIIALTAGVRQTDKEKCLRAGMSDFVAKPLVVERLIQVIRSHVAPGPDTAPPPDSALLRGGPGLSGASTAIPGLDLRQAMLRLGGDREMLQSMLRRLVGSSTGLVSALRQELESGDLMAAARRLHSLKGAAGNAGVVGLAALASSVEERIVDGRLSEVPFLLAALDDALAKLGEAVMAPDMVEPAEDPAPPANPEQRDRLVALLNDGNLAALDSYRHLAAALKTSLTGDRFAAVAAAMEKLDFKTAATILGPEENHCP